MPVVGRQGGPLGVPIIVVAQEELPDVAKFQTRPMKVRKKRDGRSQDARRIENAAQRVNAKKARMAELDEAYLIKKDELNEQLARSDLPERAKENITRQIEHLDRNLVLVKHRINQRDNLKDIEAEQLWFMAADE